jgi:hypothetical protein
VTTPKLFVNTTVDYGNLNIIGYDNSGINIIDQRTSTSGIFYSAITFRDYYLGVSSAINFYHNQYFGVGVNRLSFAVNGGDHLNILYNGNVGIGTTAPTGPLEVYRSASGGLGGYIVLNNNGAAVGNETAVIFQDGGSDGIRAAISCTTEDAPYVGNIKFKTGISVYGSLSTRMIITGAGNVGIGTTNPAGKLNVFGAKPTITSDVALLNIDDSTSFAAGVGGSLLLRGNYRGLGDQVGAAGIEASKVNSTDGDYGFNMLFYTRQNGSSLAEKMRITSAGEVWMGYTSDQGAYLLQVNGAVFASSYFESSDTRLKNITNTHNGLDFGAIQYTWKDGRDAKLHWGYAAQDVMKYIPDAVNENKDGFLSLDYNQAHTYKIAMLEKRITELEQQLKNK